ncbi:MAG: DMT family transporter [Desulfomonilaceae bacterium]
MIPRQTQSTTGYLFVLSATLIWSGNFIVARGLSDSIPPVTMAFLRGLIAVVVLIPFGIRPLCRDIKTVRKHLGYLALTGFFGLTVCNTLIYIAAHSSNALNMTLIALCSPIFLAVFARLFLHDTFTLRRIVGLITAALGAVLLITNGQLSRLMNLTLSEGDVWMLIQAATFAVYGILVQVKPAELSQSVFLSSMFILGWLFLVPWFLWELSGVKSIYFSPTAIGAIIYLGVGPSVLAFFCWNRGIEIIGPVRAGLVYYCLPLFSGVEAFLLLNEPVRWVHVLSGVLILTGVIVATRE